MSDFRLQEFAVLSAGGRLAGLRTGDPDTISEKVKQNAEIIEMQWFIKKEKEGE